MKVRSVVNNGITTAQRAVILQPISPFARILAEEIRKQNKNDRRQTANGNPKTSSPSLYLYGPVGKW